VRAGTFVFNRGEIWLSNLTHNGAAIPAGWLTKAELNLAVDWDPGNKSDPIIKKGLKSCVFAQKVSIFGHNLPL
jgi:hypothetical protein